MERKAFNSLNEAALQVQLNESDSEKPEQKPKEKSAKPKYKVVHNYTKGGKMSTQYVKAHVEYNDEVDSLDEAVLEYFNNYFGDNLNEDTSDEDIMQAVYDLIDLTEIVYNEAHTYLPDNPQNVAWHGGRERFDKLNARLGNKKKIDRKPPKVEVTRKPLKKKKKKGQLELFAANQYFEAYFGQELNENISQNDIIDAVEDLIILCEAVCDAIGIDEAFPREVSTPLGDLTAEPTNLANKQGVTIKPSPEQLKKAIAQAADNSPLLVTRGRDTFKGKPYTKAIRPSDVRDAARAKRMKRMKKFRM